MSVFYIKVTFKYKKNSAKIMMYIVLVGQRSAGKGTFAEYANQEYGLDILISSEVVEEIGLELGIITKNDVKEDVKRARSVTGTTLRNDPQYGNEFHTMRIVEKITGKSYLLDGIQHPEEIEILKRELSSVTTVGIFADYDIRCERSIKCGSAESPKHFKILEEMVSESPISGLLENADYKLENNGSVDEYYREIDDVLSQIISENS